MPRKSFPEFSSLRMLERAMLKNGVQRILFKWLAPNDNSKNQIYLGGSFEVLNIIPFEDVSIHKDRRISKRDRFKASLYLSWINSEGKIHSAPDAQLILYPKYPEVRLSGFLQRSDCAPSEALASRAEGRLLFLGIKPDGTILAHATLPDNPIAKELRRRKFDAENVLQEIIPALSPKEDSKQVLIDALKNIHDLGWIDSMRLNSNGEQIECKASQCGGYTLEALFGITPNGHAKPDYLGWEIKQHGVRNLDRPTSGGPITLMTPEPNGGFYKDSGVEKFLRKFGYKDRNGVKDRINFGGIYKVGQKTTITGLTTRLEGFNVKSGKIDEIEGGLHLLSDDGEPAAIWSFASLLKLWNTKHAKAVFVPSRMRKDPKHQYRYGNLVELGEGTEFKLFLTALDRGLVYIDPALKMENASTGNPKIKRRNQFRIKANDLPRLYRRFKQVDLTKY